MNGVAAWAFWISLATLAYVYAGFSLLVIFMAHRHRRQVRKAPCTPTLSLIIPAWNEERTIAQRLNNALALDYPREFLEIIVASDGSNDGTEAVVEKYAPEVRLLRLPRRGKISALKAAVARATGEILVFSDANSMYQAQALRKLCRNFADPEVGGVCGNQIYRKNSSADTASAGEHLYWSFDKWLKQKESLTGSIVSAHGAIYAIRRELYRPPAGAAVTDDFVISTEVIARGYRLVFEHEAVAYEEPVPAAGREFKRKVRIMNRGWRAVMLQKRLLNPWRYGFYALELFSHKILRRLVPCFLLILLVASLLLQSQHSFYYGAVAAQIAFYSLAAAGFLLRQRRLGNAKVFYIPFFYCLANLAALTALFKLAAGKRIESWQPQRYAT